MTHDDKVKLAAEYKRTHGRDDIEKCCVTWWRLQSNEGETIGACGARLRQYPESTVNWNG